MPYTKPHLTHEEQLAKVTGRGLACNNPSEAVSLLKTVGYYRISAYVYPFREFLPVPEQSGVHYRSDVIRPNVAWEHVRDLWAFDRALRLLCLDAAETIEVGIRTRIAYVLGLRSKFGHTETAALDDDRCRRARADGLTDFDGWMRRYEDLKDGARNEDYVKHHLVTYPDSELPIWVAVEFLDFGASARLFSLLKVEDQNEIAQSVGVSSGKKLHSMLRTLAYVRNLAAHHSRTWNRVLTVTLPKVYDTEVGPDLKHLAGEPMDTKLYSALAVMAYLVRNIDPRSDWARKVRERLGKKFPKVPYLTPEVDMGFPAGWADLALWQDAPRGQAFTLSRSRHRPGTGA